MADDPPEGAPEREHRRKGAVAGEQGQAAHEPTDANRENVELYAMWGLSYAQIAGILDLGETTLKKYYSAELQKGRSKGVKVAAGKLFSKILDGNLTALIFFLKCKGGFQERQQHQMVDGDGEPIDLSHISLGNESEDVLRAALAILAAALASSGAGDARQNPGGAEQEGS